jgi:aspartyl protease family protein
MDSLDSGSQAQLFYMSILGLLVAAGVVSSYRHRLGLAAQHMAIWGLIVVGLVLAYGFKDQFMGQLLGDRPIAVGDRIELRREPDGHFYALLEVNGQPVRFVVDTGATQLLLSREDARRVGIDMNTLNFSNPASTANGIVMTAFVRLTDVRLGNIVDRDVPAMVNGGEMRGSLLGMSYIERFSRFEIAGDRLYLTR